MTGWLSFASLVGLLAAPAGPAGGRFTDESAILAVGRDDQTEALKTKRLKKEVTVTDAVKVLTTYRAVTREQYLEYAHQPTGATGSVRVKGRGMCLWEIEPGYAAVVTLPHGRRVYLLHPGLKVPMARGK